jgi:hypothetical protein
LKNKLFNYNIFSKIFLTSNYNIIYIFKKDVRNKKKFTINKQNNC